MVQSAKTPVMILPTIPPMKGPKPKFPICEALKSQGGPDNILSSSLEEILVPRGHKAIEEYSPR
jgi:hypothetical protein